MVFLRQPQNIDLIAPTVFTPIFITGGKYIIGQTIARSQVKQISSAVNVPNVSVLACVFSRFLGCLDVGLLHYICSVVIYFNTDARDAYVCKNVRGNPFIKPQNNT